MRKLTAAAILFSGAIMASQSTYAGAVANDLYLGFQNQAGGGSADYIINLGSASSILNTGGVVDLSSDFIMSDFTSAGLSGTNAADIMGGVIGGDNSPKDIYATQLRSGGAGNPAVAGSSAPTELSSGTYASVYSAFAQINAPAVGSSILDTGLSWEKYVEPTLTPGSFYGASGINPDSSVSDGGIFYEDLWLDAPSGNTAEPFAYEGYFTLNLTGSDPTLTFTPSATPEPSEISLLAGGVFMFGAFRWWNKRNVRKTS